ncbi:MAG TPA: isoamylase early set domain-containing protein [Gemmatimonadales bacterium]|nr:isoamylase early set domain-containing protein [Gemmatimonadales bacterium]
MTERPDPMDAVIEALREPVDLSPDLTARVMSQVADLPPPNPLRSWWNRQWTIRFTPIQAAVAAAGLAALLVAGWLSNRSSGTAPPPDQPELSDAQLTQFVLVAPGAAVVSLVGDFNDWSTSATPLQRAAGDGVWHVTIPLTPGRYRYAFIVDGRVWRIDPEAPARDDEFGRPSSVVTVGGA